MSKSKAEKSACCLEFRFIVLSSVVYVDKMDTVLLSYTMWNLFSALKVE